MRKSEIIAVSSTVKKKQNNTNVHTNASYSPIRLSSSKAQKSPLQKRFSGVCEAESRGHSRTYTHNYNGGCNNNENI